MSLRIRLALAFAVVALLTAAVVAVASPTIVGRGFARLDPAASAAPGGGQGSGGMGYGRGPMAGMHAQQVQDETSTTLVVVAIAAALGASVVGLYLAGRIIRPLVRLESAAAAVATGDLAQRSGLAERRDEIGSLGRSFDAMTDELVRAEVSRRRFFQDAAHELRTPLAVIDATTAAMLDGVYEPDERHLETIRDQALLLGRLVEDLRTISLAEARVLPLHLEPVSVDDVVARTVAGFAARAESEAISLVTGGVPQLWVTADDRRVRQVLAALIDNGLRHTPAGGSVSVRSSRGNGLVRISVRDTGPGVASDDLPRIFERFYQADQARDRSTGTSGLGLAIAKAVVEAHGGSIGVENVRGGGARFWIELGQADAPASAPEPAPRRGRRPPTPREVTT